MEKNISAVERYALNEQLKFLRGQSFNNACVLLASRKYENITLSVVNVFDLAEQLFDEAVKRDYLNYGKIEENGKEAGKVAESPSSAEVGVDLPILLTEKEGREMDASLPKTEELVI